jgi:wobble nucleotide-excising tRNase
MVVVEDQVHILDMNQRIVTKSIVGQKVKKNLQLIIIS